MNYLSFLLLKVCYSVIVSLKYDTLEAALVLEAHPSYDAFSYVFLHIGRIALIQLNQKK